MSWNKAASYTRVSSDSQQSVMEQIERIRRLADEHGRRVARESEDERDGGTTADRAGFQKIMADALSAKRPFDTIIVYDLSRFSANSSDLTRYRDQLREAGIKLLSDREPARCCPEGSSEGMVQLTASSAANDKGTWSCMREQYNRDMKMLLDLELERNERVRKALTAYQELDEAEQALFRLAAGISQDTAGIAREPGQPPSRDGNEGTQPRQVQPLVRDLMKTLLEDYSSLLTEEDRHNLTERDYTQNILGLQLGGFPLLRRREQGTKGSDSDRQSRFYAKLYAGRFYVCSQWWRNDHLDNARSLLRFAGELAGRNPDHPGVPALDRHIKVLRDYIDRSQ